MIKEDINKPMYIEFVCPPHSYEVIASAEAPAVPRKGEVVKINNKRYEVHSVEWTIEQLTPPDKTCCPVVYLWELED
jgi:hypothetical protein